LDALSNLYNSKKLIPAVIEFVDIAGLVKGASKGEGLGNKFLSNIREVDAIVHVVRCFDDPNVIHVEGNIGPLRDIETINLELIFSDLDILERRLSKSIKGLKADKGLQKEIDLITKIKDALEEGKSARIVELEDEEKEILATLNLLTSKPIIYAANVEEDDLMDDGESNSNVSIVRNFAKEEGSEAFVISAKIEEELSSLDDEEKSAFLSDMGISDSGLDKLIAASYRLLGLISYLTAGEKETRAWTITKGTKAPGAAGKIHSDFERGFIRAEIVAYEDLMASGSYTIAKEKGLVRVEGKEYVVKDGDVVLFRFNV
jgi:GTP-binding protein YchF